MSGIVQAQLPVSDIAPDPPHVADVRAAFRTVLGLDHVEDDADFFELGGDSILAVALFLEIERRGGRKLPITTIYDASTVARLAGLLAAESGPSPHSRLVVLRDGAPDSGPPLFIVHGLGGSVMTLRDVARNMAGRHPVFGLEPVGIDGLEPPLRSVVDMARLYLADIRAVSPTGPYLLAGYSFGGLVAFEMARMLEEDGCAVRLLVLLDSFPHPTTWPMPARVRAVLRMLPMFLAAGNWKHFLNHHRDRLRGMGKMQAMRHIAHTAAGAVTLPFDIMRSGWVGRFVAKPGVSNVSPVAEEETLAGLADVGQACREAFMSYRPRRYPGKIDMIKAAKEDTEDSLRFEPRPVWRHHADGVRVHMVDADHQGLIRAGAAATGAALSACVQACLHES